MPDSILAHAVEASHRKERPSMMVGNPEPMRMDELWRCGRCGGTIRTNVDIKKGMRCKKCDSPLVVPAHPSLWETIALFFRTGTIFLMEKEKKDA